MKILKMKSVTNLSSDSRDYDFNDFIGSISETRNDPKYRSGVLKDNFVHEALLALDETGLNQSQLAKKCGKSRQYLSKLFKGDSDRKFTLDTIVELMHHLDRDVQIEYPLKNKPTDIGESVFSNTTFQFQIADDSNLRNNFADFFASRQELVPAIDVETTEVEIENGRIHS